MDISNMKVEGLVFRRLMMETPGIREISDGGSSGGGGSCGGDGKRTEE